MFLDYFIYWMYWLYWVVVSLCLFFFKQKTAYEMRISDWSSDVCSSDLSGGEGAEVGGAGEAGQAAILELGVVEHVGEQRQELAARLVDVVEVPELPRRERSRLLVAQEGRRTDDGDRKSAW